MGRRLADGRERTDASGAALGHCRIRGHPRIAPWPNPVRCDSARLRSVDAHVADVPIVEVEISDSDRLLDDPSHDQLDPLARPRFASGAVGWGQVDCDMEGQLT